MADTSAQPNTSSVQSISQGSDGTPNNESVTIDLTASQDEPTTSESSQQNAAALNDNSNQPRPSSASANPTPVSPQVPLQGLEEAARTVSTQDAAQSITAQHGHYSQQGHPPPAAQNGRPLAPAPAPLRAHGYGQVQPPAQPFYPPQPQARPPQMSYSQPAASPILMDQCPRCGLRAGEPYQPWSSPSGTMHPQYYGHGSGMPQQYPPPPMNPMQEPRPGNMPPPPGHPNAHMWVPPPGYRPPPAPPLRAPQMLNPPPPPVQAPAPAAMPSAPLALTYSPAPVYPGPAYPPRKNPNRGDLLPHIVSTRLPSPPPARQPLTLVNDPSAVRTPSGRARKSDRPYRRRMTRDERRDILLMRKLGYKMEQISRYIGATISAVNYTIRQGDPDPKHKNAGRKVNITQDKIDAIVAYAKDYLEKEKVAPVNKRTGRKTLKHLSYNMIRQAVFADENGEIPKQYKYSDDTLKSLLNKRGVWLRAPMNQAQIEIARARGKRLWQEKLDRDRLAAQAAEAAGTVVDQENPAGGGYVEAGEMGEDEEGIEDDDEDMEDASYEEDGGDDGISIPSDADEDADGDEEDQEYERSGFRPDPQSALTASMNPHMNMDMRRAQHVLPR